MKANNRKKRQIRHKNGLIAGRFQPMHLGHLRLAVAAAGMVDHLWVGITRPFGGSFPEIGGLRASDEYNPLPFWLRFKCVESALLQEASLSRERFSILPLPLIPEIIRQTIPQGAVFLTNIVEDWSVEKERLFIKSGLRVIRIDVGPKTISSTMIRQKIKIKEHGWKELVPKSIWEGYGKEIDSYVRQAL